MDPDDFWTLAGEYCTDRELEALRLKARGLTYAEAAAQLGITKSACRRRFQRAQARMRLRKQPRSGVPRP